MTTSGSATWALIDETRNLAGKIWQQVDYRHPTPRIMGGTYATGGAPVSP